ncbi:sugar transferase [Paraflavitalea sp. CAU 1676]|uniref:sugar transferase n=1 Tax=Paraflavitalea sp. CAU 1676 TaxID=3032598 RepID=UPI0023DA1F39|nr:sugar transferase [Paraflavitalea sp. CAU 1676]MDF2189532.1 sugar transferase [Paraflavitalea sp. CAU 1676]
MNVLLAPVAIDKTGTRSSPSIRRYITRKRHYFVLKRIIDIVLSIVVIAGVLSWLVPLVALLLRFDSTGPVFFRQKRVGRGGRSFVCYKFRTMVVNELADSLPADPEDLRVTRLGRWLRQTNIDELPQFLNVLEGSMSIVGPRPHMHADCRRFAEIIPRYKMRNLVKPGITGMAQIGGYHGPVRDRTDAVLRYQYDLYYIRNASIWLDIRIMTKTITRTLTAGTATPVVNNV